MKNKAKVIGISGKARSGKDTVADYIAERLEYAKRYSFAGPLKEAVSNLFDIPLNDLNEGDREKILPEFGLSVRQILQRFGTECMREQFDQDFWINKAKRNVSKLSDEEIIVISDVRFENEAKFCREDGILIHVQRPSLSGEVGDAGHASENGVHIDNESDYIIINDGSIQDLHRKIDDIIFLQ